VPGPAAPADYLAGFECLTCRTKLELGLPGVKQQELVHSSTRVGQLVGLQELSLRDSCLPLTALSGLTALQSLALHELRDVPLGDVYAMIQQLQLTSLRLSGQGVAPASAANRWHTGTFHDDALTALRTITASSLLQRLDLSGAPICTGWEQLFPTARQLLQLTSLKLPAKQPKWLSIDNFIYVPTVARPMSGANAHALVTCCPPGMYGRHCTTGPCWQQVRIAATAMHEG
jgi:hypothetical protein